MVTKVVNILKNRLMWPVYINLNAAFFFFQGRYDIASLIGFLLIGIGMNAIYYWPSLKYAIEDWID